MTRPGCTTPGETAAGNQYADASVEPGVVEDTGATELNLDRLRGHQEVYQYILANPGRYLSAVDDDSRTRTTIRSETTLMAVLADVEAAGDWSAEHVHGLVDRSLPTSRLDDLTTVSSSVWEALATADRFRPTLRNVEAYRSKAGVIDKHLGDSSSVPARLTLAKAPTARTPMGMRSTGPPPHTRY